MSYENYYKIIYVNVSWYDLTELYRCHLTYFSLIETSKVIAEARLITYRCSTTMFIIDLLLCVIEVNDRYRIQSLVCKKLYLSQQGIHCLAPFMDVLPTDKRDHIISTTII